KALKAPDAPRGWDVLDVAYRFKGTGSLGRMRFTLLLGQGRGRRLVELEGAAGPGPPWRAGGAHPPRAGRLLAARGRNPARGDQRARPRERARGKEDRWRLAGEGRQRSAALRAAMRASARALACARERSRPPARRLE